MELKAEQEKSLTVLSTRDEILKEAAAIEERARMKEAEVTEALAAVELRRSELEAQATSLQAEVDSRATELHGANAEYERVAQLLAAAHAAAASAPAPAAPGAATAVAGGLATETLAAAGASGAAAAAAIAAAMPAAATQHRAPPPASHALPMSPQSTAAMVSRAEAHGVSGMTAAELAALEARAKQLEGDRARLEAEKRDLEKSVRDMHATTASLSSTLADSEEMRRQLQDQMTSLSRCVRALVLVNLSPSPARATHRVLTSIHPSLPHSQKTHSAQRGDGAAEGARAAAGDGAQAEDCGGVAAPRGERTARQGHQAGL
jgi:hypothetical protein